MRAHAQENDVPGAAGIADEVSLHHGRVIFEDLVMNGEFPVPALGAGDDG